ncbi:MAG TPA: transporter substrate-binding domain-containing protein [Candidatus Mediterraneibacter intestinavium]|nr:transporter substrate-binding domain-containing protein [Candidatus Mediterraneibacter intestinavium]
MSLAACGSSSDDAASSESTDSAEATDSGETGDASAVETVTEGKLTVATSPDFAPYEFYAIDEDGNPTLSGFDMDLAQYIADYMGLELEIVTVDFDGVLSELQTKSVDLGMAGLSPDEKRESIMDFSDIYYMGGQSLVTVKDNADKYNSFEAINKSDVTVGAQTGSIQLDLANENTPDADIVSLPKVTDIISELISGKMDAAYIETVVAESYQKNYPELEIVMEVPYDTEGSAIGVCKDNPELLAAVNEAIAAATEDGSLDDFIAKATDLAAGQTYEGLLDESGNVQ